MKLRTYGANLVVTPEEDDLDVQIGSVNLKPASSGAYLDEAALPKIKGVFWGNNIAGVCAGAAGKRAGGRKRESPCWAPISQDAAVR